MEIIRERQAYIRIFLCRFKMQGEAGETDDDGRCLHFLFGRCLTLLLLMQIWMDDHPVRHQRVKRAVHITGLHVYEMVLTWHGCLYRF